MGRRVVNDISQDMEQIDELGISSKLYKDLKEKLKTYYDLNTQSKSIKKIQDSLNKDIKELMVSGNLDEIEIDGYKAKVTTISNVSFDPDILLAIVKEIGRDDLIKIKEYVDIDDIERLVYSEDISAESLIPAQILKEQVRLDVRKK